MSDSHYPSSNDDDNEAMAALSIGQDEALSRIMERWQKPITSYLFRNIGNYETALDLSQEVFVRIYKNRQSYKPGHRFSSYIFTIANNLAKNHFRWKSRHPETLLDPDWGANLSGDGTSHINPRIYLEKEETGDRVRHALLSLPEKLRVPTILFYYHELPQSEIAGILKCSEKSVETRLYRARQQLKNLLSRETG